MKDAKLHIPQIVVLLTSAIAMSSIVISITKSDLDNGINDKSYYLVLSTLIVAIVTIALQVVQTLIKNPTSITISLLGFPGVGKTVYLTMLYEELQKSRDGFVAFSPYGSETIEKVLTDIDTLRCGVWLPRTPVNQVFFYRAYATLKSNVFFMSLPKKFKIEFADFAGENIDEFNPQKDNWLHKTEYFEYALQSDGVFLAVDTEKYLNNIDQFRSEINGLIAAIQILAEKKGSVDGKMIIEPISIIFLKADILNEDASIEKSILNEVDRLISVCKNRFKFVKYFFVSSTGNLKDGKLSSILTPINVINPLIWLLKNNIGR
ncbi:MAG: hypothetical protein HGB12_08025 [Bacteroidetes bacterium]|nr:hypothetical protein [Bacteroidota bacterium]